MIKKNLKNGLVRSTILAGLAAVTAPTVLAQEVEATGDTAVQDTIVVTGSRIAKQDFVSNSPVSTIGSEQFELTATVNTESLLNTLPQAVPGFDRSSNNPGGGYATVNLRGLGSNRSLVLINGKRVVPTTSTGVVDLNSIPTALIEQVEVVTGGASAVYGSDAVAGVVNFVMKTDFEGIEVGASVEMSEKGDAGIQTLSLTGGTGFDDGRGHIVTSMSYTNREELFQGDRDFSQFAAWDDGEGGFVQGGSSYVPQGSIFADFSDSGFPGGIYFTEEGGLAPFRTALDGSGNDYYNYAPVNYLQLPQERFTAYSAVEYEVNEHATVYGSFNFAYNNVPQQLAATPAYDGVDISVDGNPYLTTAAQEALSLAFGYNRDADGEITTVKDGMVDTDGDGIFDTVTTNRLRRRMLEVGERYSDDKFYSAQFQVGLKGDVNDSVSYDIYFQDGRVLNSTSQIGNINLDRWQSALLLADADNDGNVDVDADGNPTCADASGGCAPMNLYGYGNISPEAASYVTTRVNADADYNQTLFAANLTGSNMGALALPGGAIGWSIGAEYREETFKFSPSQDLATGSISGFNGAPPIEGSFDVYDLYGEVYLPILSDVPFADILAMELAYRTSDYSTSGSVDSYKISGEWAPVEDFRFRASFNTAVRAPNIFELFAPAGEGFPGAEDPCSADNPDAASIAALCQATGVPANQVGSTLIQPASGQVRSLSGGNPNLVPEEAETLTVGFVYEPSFVEGLTVSLDYFDIQIEDSIASFGGGANNILDTCYNDTVKGGLGSVYCSAIVREADGLVDYVTELSENVASESLSGFDLQANYGFDLPGTWGDMNLAYLGTYTEEASTLPEPGGTEIECAGAFGVNCDNPLPNYKHRFTATWSLDSFTTQVMWRHIGSVEDDSDSVYSVEEIDPYNYFDISTSWVANDYLTLTGGIDNLFGQDPEFIGDNQQQANTYPAVYDVYGRTFFLSAKASF